MGNNIVRLSKLDKTRASLSTWLSSKVPCKQITTKQHKAYKHTITQTLNTNALFSSIRIHRTTRLKLQRIRFFVLESGSEPWPFSEKRLAPNAKSGYGGSACAARGGRSPARIGTLPATVERTAHVAANDQEKLIKSWDVTTSTRGTLTPCSLFPSFVPKFKDSYVTVNQILCIVRNNLTRTDQTQTNI